MSNCQIWFLIFICTLLHVKGALAQKTEKPNVILILTDDQGYGDLSCHGNPILKTPAIDKLYNESVVFTDFHVSSICTPTRSQILTGLDACRNGAFAWAYSREIIHPEIPTMAKIFRKNGYTTGHFGKWHLGDNYPYRPIDRGFDESVKHGGASIYQTPDYWNNDYQDDYFEHNGVMEKYNGYCTDIWFEQAKKFIRKSKNKPFFIYLPTNTPHAPHIVNEKYSKPYLEILEKGYKPVPEFAGQKNKPEDISWFYGMIANIDENLAKLDEFLKANNLFDNTILIFMSDNGGTGGVRVYNVGMRGKKQSLYDGGHRVPFFLRWPAGGLNGHREIDALTQSQDVLPTLVDFCGLKTEVSQFDGESLKPLILGAKTNLDDRILVMQNARAPLPVKYDATIMWKKWRLVAGKELYNIESDPAQKTDVAANYPEVVEKMKAHYEKWWQSVQSSLRKVPAFPMGGKNCRELTLTCFDWHGKEGEGNVTVQPDIRKGKKVSGYWNIEILEDGEYEIRCSRYPEEARTKIRGALPPHKTMTITYPAGVALPIYSAKIKIGAEVQTVPVYEKDVFATARFHLKKGKYTLRNEFFNKNNELVCGAYYAYLKKLGTAVSKP